MIDYTDADVIEKAVIWYYEIDPEDSDAVQRKTKQLTQTQRQEILWAYEDYLIASGQY
jgi:hypothetical protein